MNPPSNLGICPTFHLGPFDVPAYGTLLLLALAAAVVVALWQARREGFAGESGLLLVGAAFFGGILGAKIPAWIEAWPAITHARSTSELLVLLASGRTVVGGLIGGTLAVLLARRRLGITRASGNLFAPAMALAIAIGRWGCLCGGCCAGQVTTSPLAMRLGDGLLHYPTQLLESAFATGLFLYLLAAARRQPTPGTLFRAFMLAYFTFRFFIEFLRTGTPVAMGLTPAQLVSAGVVLYYLVTSPRKEAVHAG